MASITTRVNGAGQTGVTVKGAPLTNSEIDQNFLNLNSVKLESTWTGATSLSTVGTVSTGTWQATTISTAYGGTGLSGAAPFTLNGALYATSTSALTTGTLPIASGGTATTTVPANGRLLIGNGTGYTVAALTQTNNQVIVTNGAGTITLSTPQDIATTSNVQFGSFGVGVAGSATAGTARINNSLSVGSTATPSGIDGEIRASNKITSFYSDERLKTNIQQIDNALEKVMSLRGVTYYGNNIAESFGYDTKERHVGVLAGEIEKVLPEIVQPAPFDIMVYEGAEMSRSGENYKTVQYELIVPLLIEAIKELNEEVKRLKSV